MHRIFFFLLLLTSCSSEEPIIDKYEIADIIFDKIRHSIIESGHDKNTDKLDKLSIDKHGYNFKTAIEKCVSKIKIDRDHQEDIVKYFQAYRDVIVKGDSQITVNKYDEDLSNLVSKIFDDCGASLIDTLK